MDTRTYSMEVKLNPGDAFTFETLNVFIRSVFTDDDLIFTDRFIVKLIFREGISFEELKRDTQHLQRHGTDSGYYWKFPRAVMGDKYPELHVELIREKNP